MGIISYSLHRLVDIIVLDILFTSSWVLQTAEPMLVSVFRHVVGLEHRRCLKRKRKSKKQKIEFPRTTEDHDHHRNLS